MHSCAASRSSTQLTGTAYVKADCQLYSLPPPPACEAAPYAASFAFRAGPSASGSHALMCRPRIVHPAHRRGIRGGGLSASQPDTSQRTTPPQGRPHRSGSYAHMCRPRDVHLTTTQRICIYIHTRAGGIHPTALWRSPGGAWPRPHTLPSRRGREIDDERAARGCAWRAASPEVPTSPRLVRRAAPARGALRRNERRSVRRWVSGLTAAACTLARRELATP